MEKQLNYRTMKETVKKIKNKMKTEKTMISQK